MRYFVLNGLRVDLLPDGTWFCENDVVVNALEGLDLLWMKQYSPADGDPLGYIFDKAVALLNPENVVDDTEYHASMLGEN